MTLTNAQADWLEAAEIKRDQDWYDSLDASFVDYEEMTGGQALVELRAARPELFNESAGLWQDDRDSDREARRDDDLRPRSAVSESQRGAA